MMFARKNSLRFLQRFQKKNSKKSSIPQKTNSERFEKPYCSSRIVRQVCHHLVNKIHHEKRERTSRKQLANIVLIEFSLSR